MYLPVKSSMLAAALTLKPTRRQLFFVSIILYLYEICFSRKSQNIYILFYLLKKNFFLIILNKILFIYL